MTNIFLKIYSFLQPRRWLTAALLLLIVALCVVGVSRLRWSEDISGFLPEDSRNERINWAFAHAGGDNKIVVNISADDDDVSIICQAVDDFVERVEQSDAADYISTIIYRVDATQIAGVARFITHNMPYYLDTADYERIDSLMQPERIAARLESVKGILISPAGMVLKSTLVNDPLLFSSTLLAGLESFRVGDSFEIYDDYIFSRDLKEAVVTIDLKSASSDTAAAAVFTRAIDSAARECETAFDKRISIRPFGASYIALTNSNQIKRDSFLSIVIAVILIMALLIYFFRDWRSIVLIGVSMIFGGLFAVGAIGLCGNAVSLIAIGAGSIILGIAINYPLHMLTHIKAGYTPRQSLVDIVQPLTTGNITTVGAFLSLLFISSAAMRDLGLFASLLLVGTILFVLVFLPQLTRPAAGRMHASFGLLSESHPESNRWIVLAMVVVTAVLWPFGSRVEFDTNLQSINYMTSEQRASMDKMLTYTQGSRHLMYFAVEGDHMQHALENYERVVPLLDSIAEADSAVLRLSGIGRYLPSKSLQAERLAMWNGFWNERRDGFLDNFHRASAAVGFREGAFADFESVIEQQYTPQEIVHFEPIVSAMASNYLSSDDRRAMVYTLINVRPEAALQLEERLNGIDSDAFAFDSGSVTRNMVSLLSEDFDYVLYVCGLIVLLFLTASFGRIELSLISFLPLVVSWIWILGLMGIFSMKFNIVNIILATFIFGMGDDYTIFITEGLMYEYTYGKRMLSTYKNTVALSACLMFIGIGSLIVARHPALSSLAHVTIVGMFSVVVMTYVIPPFLFRWLTRKGSHVRRYPLTLVNLAASVYAFAFFLVGSLMLTVTGFVLLTLGGRSDAHRLRYHRILCRSSHWIMHHIPFAPARILNPSGERFERPSVIVSNHQSHLDLMAALMLTPKIVIVTNHWVWHSPFYGRIIRYADFCPIENMLSDDLSALEQMVRRGYSILVYPEGTRSEDCRIGRFHKGAFYLAQRFGLDIVPVVLHGFGHVLPKSDFLLHRGGLTVEIQPRIPLSELSNMGDLSAQTKACRNRLSERYRTLAAEIQTPRYFADSVIHNYIYKGAEVERSARRLLRRENYFEQQITSLPEKGRVLVMDSGRGELSLLASLVRGDVQFDSFIADPERRLLAANCASVPPNLHYVDAIEQDYDFVLESTSTEARK